MMKHTCLVLSISLWLAGCATPGTVDRPALEIPEQWRSLPSQTVADAPAPWAALFARPDLAALLQAARDNNRSLRAAAARVDAAAASYGVLRAQRWPALNAQGAASRGKQPVSAALDNQIGESTQLAAALSWELDLWGRIADQAESGRQSWLSAEETYRAAQVSLDTQVAGGWLLLLELDEQLLIAERTVASQATSLDLVRRRFKGGVVSMVDVNQAESALAGAESTRADIGRACAQAENALAILIGRPPHAVPRSGMVSDLSRPTALPVGLPADLLLNRPDVRAAERALESTQHGVFAARKAWLPSIKLTGMLGWASYDLSKVVSTGTEAWSAGGVINLPIFNGGSLMAQLDLAEARQREAAETYAGSVLQGLREVEDAIVGFQRLSEQSDALARRVKATRERLRLADMRYRAGVTDYFEVLNAQQDLLAAELSAVQASRGSQAALLQLYAALGGAESGAPRAQ
ncbi:MULTISPECIES: efflux transporter outer membrane subunit [unclassified Uliginosibacterium]|uniref:efflux transporter outer membrane subunit n=1 Tax=unclassified Uliginosibacterium TaxID=2621521 RepID=UPI000C7CFB1C|nr:MULTISPECIES: efflux transporter outer membrane subunit [unclassified Uliginosibacterium]MDO6385922.1 efflux transporter outer membrane subunit [Uliginosibacterium sp. 31-12]PLK49932.1 transporter [Uliginosibacterium sp. TH139]